MHQERRGGVENAELSRMTKRKPLLLMIFRNMCCCRLCCAILILFSYTQATAAATEEDACQKQTDYYCRADFGGDMHTGTIIK